MKWFCRNDSVPFPWGICSRMICDSTRHKSAKTFFNACQGLNSQQYLDNLEMLWPLAADGGHQKPAFPAHILNFNCWWSLHSVVDWLILTRWLLQPSTRPSTLTSFFPLRIKAFSFHSYPPAYYYWKRRGFSVTYSTRIFQALKTNKPWMNHK